MNIQLLKRNCCLLVFLISTSAYSQVSLPKLISNGMVLQRGTSIPVWGWASPGEKVTVSFDGKNHITNAAANRKWTVKLEPMSAGGPYTMEITASNHITIQNILVGDVWICSGQSNMELKMDRVKNKYPDVVANSDNPNIRQFLVDQKYSFSAPLDDVKSAGWKPADPKNVLQFTAVGYFFAKELYQKYKVPIGLILSSWGGTPAEAWMSEDALKAFPKYDEIAKKLQDTATVNQISRNDNSLRDAWYKQVKQQDEGLANAGSKWYSAGYNASGWGTLKMPGYWEDQGVKNIDGVVWLRKELDLPASTSGKNARLILGNIVDIDSTYINGLKVGTTSNRYQPREYQVPQNLLKPGKNVITVRVINREGPGGFVKDKPYQLITDGQTIDLAGDWQYKTGVAVKPLPAGTIFAYQPLCLFNGMIAPLIPYAIKGVIWYQGEANSSKGLEYRSLFPALISNWRQKWGQGEFPFLYVQLASYMATKSEPAESKWAELREAQLKTLSVPNTGMAVASDIGEWNDVHPLDKEDVGKRLALAAAKVAYHQPNVVYSGPIYQSMKKEGNKIIITFNNTGSGLLAKGGMELKYFSIAADDKQFVWAKARIHGNTVVVWSDDIKNPVAVRYAWADNPEGANLYNREGLPASPFRTDNQ